MGVANRGSYQRANATNLFNMWTGWVRCVPSMLCCSLGPLPKVLSQILDRAFYGSRNQGTKKPVPSLWLHSEPHSRDPAFPCSCAIVSWESHLRSSSIGLDPAPLALIPNASYLCSAGSPLADALGNQNPSAAAGSPVGDRGRLCSRDTRRELLSGSYQTPQDGSLVDTV